MTRQRITKEVSASNHYSAGMQLSFLYTNQKGETKKVRGYIVSTFEYVGPSGEPLGTYGHRIQTPNCEHVKTYKEVAMFNVTIVEAETVA